MMPEPTRIGNCTLYLGNCLAVLRHLPSNSFESCITDPPSGTGFMGKEWDDFGRIIQGKIRSTDPEKNTKGLFPGYGRGGSPDDRLSHTRRSRDVFIPWLTTIMQEVYRVLKPGAHALVWALPRTSHWTAMACEDAGFEIRDSILHLFSSGYPKSHNISKSIDQYFGAEREVVGVTQHPDGRPRNHVHQDEGIHGGGQTRNGIGLPVTAPVTEAAKQYQGWGSALAPAHETWWLCRKPLSESTLAKNVLRWGTGGINIDGCRIEGESWGTRPKYRLTSKGVSGGAFGNPDAPKQERLDGIAEYTQGRWPKNVLLDGSEAVTSQFPVAPGQQSAVTGEEPTGSGFSGKVYSTMHGTRHPHQPRQETETSAARFYYCSKASSEDRGVNNSHPTVKSTNLMCYLIRLITPPGGTVLDPFMGSGSTGKAAVLEGKAFLGIEQEEEYYTIATSRITAASQQLSFLS